MYTLEFSSMEEVPDKTKERLRNLSFGPSEGTMWRWTFQEGRCYAAIIRSKGVPIGWACLTYCDDRFPVVGVYVEPSARGQGLGATVANYMLERAGIAAGAYVYAVSSLWAGWPSLLLRHGLVHLEWE